MLRHYSESDAAMRQHQRTMQAHYVANEAAFRAFNPEFDADFGQHWLAALDLADATPDHTARVGELKEHTAEVTDVMTQAQGAVQTLFYFVGRAFPHNVGRLDQYGRRTYEAARKQHDKMRTLLQTAFASATRDHAALAAKGYAAAQLAALGTLVTQLAATNTTQEVAKGTNVEGTGHYLTVQNLAYGFGQEVSAAAKILFAADAPTLALFRLGGSPAPAGLEHHELTADADAAATVVFATALAPTTRLHLRLAVPGAGQSALVGRAAAPTDALATPVTLSAATTERTLTAAELGPAGQVLVVRSGGIYPVRVEITVLG